MLSKRIFALCAIVLVLALSLPAASVQASVLPQERGPHAGPRCPKLSAAQRQDETLMNSLPAECAANLQVVQPGEGGAAYSPAPMAQGGPDGFGYVSDDSVAFNWIDTSAGTDTGFTGSPVNGQSLSVNLPFSFNFYENTYSSLYVIPQGFVTFLNYGGYDRVGPIPGFSYPNNLIAPYRTMMYIGAGGWVHYMSGGTAPNRYFVVEWHDIKGAAPSYPTGFDDTFRFETILYENGDIVFQYGSMSYVSGYYCASAGIEDMRGMDGLGYVNYCTQAPSNRAVRFTRPAPAARVGVAPKQQSALVSSLSTTTFDVNVRNTGDLGDDTLDLTANSPWPVSFFETDGVTPLTDTDGDTIVDTGLLPRGVNGKTMTVSFAVPDGLQLNDSVVAEIIATSSIDPTRTKTINLTMTAPAKFAQVFTASRGGSNPGGAMSLMSSSPADISTYSATPDKYPGYNVAVTKTVGGDFLYAWTKLNPSTYDNTVEYMLMRPDGSSLRPVSTIPVPASTTTYVEDYYPAVAAAPDGHLAIVWEHYGYNPGQKDIDNAFLEIFDSQGNLTYGPLNLSHNTLGDSRYIYDPAVTATDDNRFVVSWNGYNDNNYTDNIWVGSYATSGAVVKAPSAITADNTSYGPFLNSLPGNRVVMTSRKYNGGSYYTVLGSNGNVIKSETNLNVPGAYRTADAVAVRGDRLVFGVSTRTGVTLKAYDANFNPVPGAQATASNTYTANGNSALSLTTDVRGSVILNWQDTDSNNLLYALANNSAQFIIAPQQNLAMYAYLETSWNGQGSVPITKFQDAPVSFWATPWIEGLSAAGVTSGCGVRYYCPGTIVTRDQMAVFLIRAKGINPPDATGTMFTDVPASFWAAKWIEELAREGITTGCGGGKYCPGAAVTRDQMAVFLLRAQNITPPAATGQVFTDVPVTHWAANWIEELARRGITSGCSATQYCPGNPVTRDQMAVFLVRSFNLPFEAPLP